MLGIGPCQNTEVTPCNLFVRNNDVVRLFSGVEIDGNKFVGGVTTVATDEGPDKRGKVRHGTAWDVVDKHVFVAGVNDRPFSRQTPRGDIYCGSVQAAKDPFGQKPLTQLLWRIDAGLPVVHRRQNLPQKQAR